MTQKATVGKTQYVVIYENARGHVSYMVLKADNVEEAIKKAEIYAGRKEDRPNKALSVYEAKKVWSNNIELEE